ncbi:MAG: PLP-dependent aminotransferase family protein [Clostridia bacterium]|nr:PLP-dependent aminotransferase family protein [Clostridia bacterium]
MDLSSLRFAHRFDQVSGSAIREIFKIIARPGMISFAGGNPSLAALPDEKVSELSVQVLRDHGKQLLQYGATEGYPPFLESLKQYVETVVGFRPDAVLPVTGSTQAMDLLCKALIDPGDTILVENPSFLGNLQCMKLYQANLVPVASDDDGMDPADLEEKIKAYHPKMVYTIPTFQNPSGRTLSLARREKVAALAAEYGVVIAEDDPYRDLRYRGEMLPSIKSFDREGWVVFLGSFSKIISPGLRVGYLAGREEIIRKCTVGKQSTDVHTANLTQAIVDQFIRQNLLPDHIRTICADYGEKLARMLGHLEDLAGLVTFTRPEGGLFVWAELPEGLNALELLKKAIDQGVAYVPGTHFFVDGGHENTLRLNFSNSTDDQIDRGMSVLKTIFREAK